MESQVNWLTFMVVALAFLLLVVCIVVGLLIDQMRRLDEKLAEHLRLDNRYDYTDDEKKRT